MIYPLNEGLFSKSQNCIGTVNSGIRTQILDSFLSEKLLWFYFGLAKLWTLSTQIKLTQYMQKLFKMYEWRKTIYRI